jgi:Sulfatase
MRDGKGRMYAQEGRLMTKIVWATLLAFIVAGLLAVVPVRAQQIAGTPGSPGATTTIDGRYLPPPPQQFRGEISPNAVDSKPYWPALVAPPKGAPNILLIMTDDVGFSAPSTFGGVIPTLALDRIAASGLRYTRFHTTALCSPTRRSRASRC